MQKFREEYVIHIIAVARMLFARQYETQTYCHYFAVQELITTLSILLQWLYLSFVSELFSVSLLQVGFDIRPVPTTQMVIYRE